MTVWKELRLRAGLIADKLAWGLRDLRRISFEMGILPAQTFNCSDALGGKYAVVGEKVSIQSSARAPDSLVILEPDCLWGVALLPSMGAEALTSAVTEILWRESPLPPEQMIAAWRTVPDGSGAWTVEWAVSKRSLQDSLREKLGLSENSPTFLCKGSKALLVADRTGSTKRFKLRRFDIYGYLLILLVALSVCALVLMPIVIKRQGAVRAYQSLVSAESTAGPLRQKLEILRQQTKQAEELRLSMNSAVPTSVVVEALSSALPDDTWLDRIDINENEIRITGMTGNANDLITYLGRSTFFSDVKATAPNLRDASLNKERFAFEMKWRAEVRP